MLFDLELYLIEILHQTTTESHSSSVTSCCILSKFYIKPQRARAPSVLAVVVSYRNSTSNHNTSFRPFMSVKGCILSKFYIKPQRHACRLCVTKVVSYRNSTSNHNANVPLYSYWVLYLIEILHQTTTASTVLLVSKVLYLIEILHQTTTLPLAILLLLRCILSKFYIKPQRLALAVLVIRVVSYRNSTSNHNVMSAQAFMMKLYLIEILHQTTTALFGCRRPLSCILSKFYIKPQLLGELSERHPGCILSKFYIKPQLYPVDECPAIRCILSKFYIKPQLWGLTHRPGSRCILSKFYIKPQLLAVLS